MQPGRSLLGAGRLLILQKIHDRTFIRARTLIDFEMKFLAGIFLKIYKRPAPNKELPGREKVVQDVFLLSAYEVTNKYPARHFIQN